MEIIDLYSQYEGYQKITLIEETFGGQQIFSVQLLAHHFDEILSLIPLGDYHVDSVMYNYFRAEGWHNKKWECKRVQEFYEQLVALEGLVCEELTATYNAIKQICNALLKNDHQLFIILD